MNIDDIPFTDGFIDFEIEYSKKVNSKEIQIKRGVLFTIQISYQQNLNDYLSINPLSEEIDFIQLISENQKKRIDELGKQIDFFFNPDILKQKDVQKIWNNQEYWHFKLYQLFLKKRMDYLNRNDLQKESQIEPPQQDNSPDLNTWNKVSEYIQKYDDYFRSENDFNTWRKLIISLADGTNYEIPSKLISLKKGKKSEFAALLNTIFDVLMLKNKIDQFYEINRVIDEFSEYQNSHTFKAYISRKGRFN